MGLTLLHFEFKKGHRSIATLPRICPIVVLALVMYKNPTPNPLPASRATVYTPVIESLSFLELPHPNPPLGNGRELDFPVSPLSKGGLRGVIRLLCTP